MKKTILGFLVLILTLMIMGSALAVTNPLPTVEVRDVSWFERVFMGADDGTLSVVGSDASIPKVRAGDYFDLAFMWKCDSSYSAQDNKFTRGYYNYEALGQWSNHIPGSSGAITNLREILFPNTGGQCSSSYKEIIFRNIQVPNLGSSACGTKVSVMVEHQRGSFGNFGIDEEKQGFRNHGFQPIKQIEYTCETQNTCTGLTGQKSGSNYCSGGDVVADFFTGQQSGSRCVTNTQLVQACQNGCSGGSCVTTTTISGYVLQNNRCDQASYQSNQQQPANFYTSLSACTANIIDDTPQVLTGWILENNNCRSIQYTAGDPVEVFSSESACRATVELVCNSVYQPVCGVDSKTYTNSCQLNKAGVMLQHEGVCQTEIVDDDDDLIDEPGDSSPKKNIFVQFWEWLTGLFK